MNVYNIKMENLNYTRGYYSNVPEEVMMTMKQKMRHDCLVNQLAWHYLDAVSKSEHTLRDSAHYKMHNNWAQWYSRECDK